MTPEAVAAALQQLDMSYWANFLSSDLRSVLRQAARLLSERTPETAYDDAPDELSALKAELAAVTAERDQHRLSMELAAQHWEEYKQREAMLEGQLGAWRSTFGTDDPTQAQRKIDEQIKAYDSALQMSVRMETYNEVQEECLAAEVKLAALLALLADYWETYGGRPGIESWLSLLGKAKAK